MLQSLVHSKFNVNILKFLHPPHIDIYHIFWLLDQCLAPSRWKREESVGCKYMGSVKLEHCHVTEYEHLNKTSPNPVHVMLLTD